MFGETEMVPEHTTRARRADDGVDPLDSILECFAGAAYERLEAHLDENYYAGARDDLREVAFRASPIVPNNPDLSAVLRIIDSCGGAKMAGESDDHHAGYHAALNACELEMTRAWPRLTQLKQEI